MFSNEQTKDLSQRIKDLHTYLEIEKKEIEIVNEEERAASPDFWNHPKEAEIFMKSLRSKKKWVEDYYKIRDSYNDLEVLVEFNKEGEASDEDVQQQYNQTLQFLEEIEFRNMLSEEGDNLSAVLQITSGAGGTESCDWEGMLMRMY